MIEAPDTTVEVREIELSAPQTDVFLSRASLTLDMAGQGAGKTENIGIHAGWLIANFPEIEGFIGANTYGQLSQATLKKAFATWKKYYGWDEYDAKTNPTGFYVVDKIPPAHFETRGVKLKTYSNTISFRNGGLIITGSLDNYKVHDGKEFGWAHLDETKDTKESALTTVILARLRQRGLWVTEDGDVICDTKKTNEQAEAEGLKAWNPCFIHTSPSEGNVEWLTKMFKLDKREEEIRRKIEDDYDYFYSNDGFICSVIYQTNWNEENLPPNYIEGQKRRMTEAEQLKFIKGYPFSKSGGEYYPHFYRSKHVRKLEIKPELAFNLSYDFNVLPYMTQLLFQVEYVTKWYSKEKDEKSDIPKQGYEPMQVMEIRLVKEYAMKPPYNTTEASAEAFVADVENEGWQPDVFVYGDSSGRNRIVGLGSETQYKIIERRLRRYLRNGWLKCPLSNISVLKRRDLMNKILEGKIPQVEFYIDEKCEQAIRDMEFLKQSPTGKLKERETDKNGVSYEKIGHMSDAIEYFVCVILKAYLKM